MTSENPEGWRPPVDRDDVEAALNEIDTQAADHNAEYAAGMRNARLIIEEYITS